MARRLHLRGAFSALWHAGWRCRSVFVMRFLNIKRRSLGSMPLPSGT